MNAYHQPHQHQHQHHHHQQQQQHHYQHPQHQQQQHHSYYDTSVSAYAQPHAHHAQHHPHPQRMQSDNFIASAGPPSPGKMSMLPHGGGPPHQHGYGQHAQQPSRSEVYEPLPPSPTRAPQSKGSSTTSEFTKRKNWSQRIVEEMQDMLHVLSPSGVFLFASPSVLELTGYAAEEVVGRGITDFVAPEDTDNFVRDFTAAIHADAPLTTYVRLRRKDGLPVLFEITGQPYYTGADGAPAVPAALEPAAAAVQVQAGPDGAAAGGGAKVCKCFFAMARLYPGKNSAMLDSFLELKVENEKLRQRLAEIYREIEGDPEDPTSLSAQRAAAAAQGGVQGMDLERPISGFPQRGGQVGNPNLAGYGYLPSAADDATMYYPFASTSAAGQDGYLQQQQHQPSQQQQQQSQQQQQQGMQGSFGGSGGGSAGQAGGASDPMRGSAIDQNNVLVSSAGLIPSTSNTYGALGIGISSANARSQGQAQSGGSGAGAGGGSGAPGQPGAPDDDPDGKKKKQKKQRVEEGEFVCRDCGTVDSPEWRRGPLGPKTLCNACGLRWAKKNKQSRNSIGGVDGVAQS